MDYGGWINGGFLDYCIDYSGLLWHYGDWMGWMGCSYATDGWPEIGPKPLGPRQRPAPKPPRYSWRVAGNGRWLFFWCWSVELCWTICRNLDKKLLQPRHSHSLNLMSVIWLTCHRWKIWKGKKRSIGLIQITNGNRLLNRLVGIFQMIRIWFKWLQLHSTSLFSWFFSWFFSSFLKLWWLFARGESVTFPCARKF